ncbi:MAG: 50S ribosomal protein L18 [Candidatus Paceibacterota bacterium]
MNIRNKTKLKIQRKSDRHRRVRAKISGVAASPRLCVFRSNKHIVAQLIDDQKGLTLAVCGDSIKKSDAKKTVVGDKGELKGKCAIAFEVGQDIAKKAQELKTKKVVFDRGGYRYHGRVKSLAAGARKGGLEF